MTKNIFQGIEDSIKSLKELIEQRDGVYVWVRIEGSTLAEVTPKAVLKEILGQTHWLPAVPRVGEVIEWSSILSMRVREVRYQFSASNPVIDVSLFSPSAKRGV